MRIRPATLLLLTALSTLALPTVGAAQYTMSGSGNLAADGSVLGTAAAGDLIIWNTTETTSNRYFGPTTSPYTVEADMQIGDDNGNGGMYIYDGNSGVTMVFNGAVTGSGTISKRRAGADNTWEFTGDVSRFQGDIVLAESLFNSTTAGGFSMVFSGSTARENVSGTGSIVFGRATPDVNNGKWDNRLVYNYSADVTIGNRISKASGTTATSNVTVNGGASNTFTGAVQIDNLVVDGAEGSTGTSVSFTNASLGQVTLGESSRITLHNTTANATVRVDNITLAAKAAIAVHNTADNATVQAGDYAFTDGSSLTVTDGGGCRSTTQFGNVVLNNGTRLHVGSDVTVAGTFNSYAQAGFENRMPERAEVRIGGTMILGQTSTLYRTDLAVGTLNLTGGTFSFQNMAGLTAREVTMADNAKLTLANHSGQGGALGTVTGGYLDAKSTVTAGSVNVLKFNSDYYCNLTVNGDFVARDYFNTTGTTSTTAAQKGSVLNVHGNFTSTGSSNSATNLRLNAENITFTTASASSMLGVDLHARGNLVLKNTATTGTNYYTIGGNSNISADGDMQLDRIRLYAAKANRGTLTLEAGGTITLGTVKMDPVGNTVYVDGINITAAELDINSSSCVLYSDKAPNTQVNLQVDKLDAHYTTTIKHLAQGSKVGEVVVDAGRTLTLQGHGSDTAVQATSMQLEGNLSVSNMELTVQSGAINLRDGSYLDLGDNVTLCNTRVTGGEIYAGGANTHLGNVVLDGVAINCFGSGSAVEMENVTMSNMTISRAALKAFISDPDLLTITSPILQMSGELTQTGVFATGGSLNSVTLELDVNAALLAATKQNFTITLTDGTTFDTDTQLTLGESLLGTTGVYELHLLADGIEVMPDEHGAYMILAGQDPQTVVLTANYVFPEPSTSTLALLGLAGMVSRRRRRQ